MYKTIMLTSYPELLLEYFSAKDFVNITEEEAQIVYEELVEWGVIECVLEK